MGTNESQLTLVFPEARLCEQCGTPHFQKNSPVCGRCRREGSKKTCPVDGCGILINVQAKTCLKHRRLFYGQTFSSCAECGGTLDRLRVPICRGCIGKTKILCACGCGRYRRKYDMKGRSSEFVSGHNDNWQDNRRPLAICAVCRKAFKAKASRQRLCSVECRTAWLTINPSKERKRIAVDCAACGKVIYRAPHQMEESRAYACSRRCQYIIVANKLRGKPLTDPRRIALRRDGGRCVVCGFDELVEIHHIVPKREGGIDVVDNLVALCPNHHGLADRGLISREDLHGYARARALA